MRRPSKPSTRLIFALIIVAFLAVGTVAAAFRDTPTSTQAFIADAEGLSLVQHGFSVANSSKSSIDGLPIFTEADLQVEQDDIGTNFVRFLISWNAVEPEPGVIDHDYLRAVEERVSWYTDRNYHVMLDMHQDLWGPAIGDNIPKGWGNGAPAWATHMDGLPVANSDMWELIYLEPGVIRAFDHFWNTSGKHPELMQHYASAWQAVAKHFADNDTVVAYDLMNEPYGGTLQGVAFESGPLTKLYQLTTDAIREVDNDTWVCVEPQAFGFNWGLPSALGQIQDKRDGDPRVAFCPHLYPLPMDLGDGYTGTSRTLIDGTVAAWTNNVLRTAQVLSTTSTPVPIILGEFGLDTAGEGAEDYVRLVYDTAASHGFGVAYWSRDPGSWGPYEEDGTPRNLSVWLNKPYPMAAQGLTAWSADYQSLKISMQPSGKAEVYLPHNMRAGEPQVVGAKISSWHPANGHLTLLAEQSGEVEIVLN